MGEYQNGYAEWKKLDPKKKKYILYDSILSLEMQNAKQSTLIESKAVFAWRERSWEGLDRS